MTGKNSGVVWTIASIGVGSVYLILRGAKNSRKPQALGATSPEEREAVREGLEDVDVPEKGVQYDLKESRRPWYAPKERVKCANALKSTRKDSEYRLYLCDLAQRYGIPLSDLIDYAENSPKDGNTDYTLSRVLWLDGSSQNSRALLRFVRVLHKHGSYASNDPTRRSIRVAEQVSSMLRSRWQGVGDGNSSDNLIRATSRLSDSELLKVLYSMSYSNSWDRFGRDVLGINYVLATQDEWLQALKKLSAKSLAEVEHEAALRIQGVEYRKPPRIKELPATAPRSMRALSEMLSRRIKNTPHFDSYTRLDLLDSLDNVLRVQWPDPDLLLSKPVEFSTVGSMIKRYGDGIGKRLSRLAQRDPKHADDLIGALQGSIGLSISHESLREAIMATPIDKMATVAEYTKALKESAKKHTDVSVRRSRDQLAQRDPGWAIATWPQAYEIGKEFAPVLRDVLKFLRYTAKQGKKIFIHGRDGELLVELLARMGIKAFYGITSSQLTKAGNDKTRDKSYFKYLHTVCPKDAVHVDSGLSGSIPDWFKKNGFGVSEVWLVGSEVPERQIPLSIECKKSLDARNVSATDAMLHAMEDYNRLDSPRTWKEGGREISYSNDAPAFWAKLYGAADALKLPRKGVTKNATLSGLRPFRMVRGRA